VDRDTFEKELESMVTDGVITQAYDAESFVFVE